MTKEDFIGYIASFFISLLVFVFLTEVLPVIYDYVLAKFKRHGVDPHMTQPLRDITYIQNQRSIQLEKKEPEWEKEGYELSELILDSIELIVKSNPLRTYYDLHNYDLHNKVDYLRASPVARKVCIERLKQLGFEVEETDSIRCTVKW